MHYLKYTSIIKICYYILLLQRCFPGTSVKSFVEFSKVLKENIFYLEYT